MVWITLQHKISGGPVVNDKNELIDFRLKNIGFVFQSYNLIPGENRDTEIVSIPGLQGRDPKEITLKNSLF